MAQPKHSRGVSTIETIEIENPTPGGSWYTTVKKAHQFVERGIAVIEYGRLRFIDRPHPARQEVSDVVLWNGHPKPKITSKVSLKTIIQEETSRGVPMHRPGEVRS